MDDDDDEGEDDDEGSIFFWRYVGFVNDMALVKLSKEWECWKRGIVRIS